MFVFLLLLVSVGGKPFVLDSKERMVELKEHGVENRNAEIIWDNNFRIKRGERMNAQMNDNNDINDGKKLMRERRLVVYNSYSVLTQTNRKMKHVEHRNEWNSPRSSTHQASRNSAHRSSVSNFCIHLILLLLFHVFCRVVMYG